MKPCKSAMICTYLFVLLCTILIGCSSKRDNINENETQATTSSNNVISTPKDNSGGESMYIVTVNGKVGFINKDGQYVIKPEYDSGLNFSEKLAVVKKNNKYGFIDSYGKTVIEFKYDSADSFSEGLAAVQIGDKWGYVNTEGKLLIDCKFDSAAAFREDKAAVGIGTKYGYINKEGKIIIEPNFDEAGIFDKGFAVIRKDSINGSQYYFINKNGDFEFNRSFDLCGSFSEDLAWVMKGNKYSDDNLLYGFIDIKGNEVIAEKYTFADDFKEGLAIVCYNQRYGFIDKNGNVVIDYKFENALSFSEQLCAAKQNNKWGFINKRGEWVIEPQYDSAESFYQDLAQVKAGDKTIYIDKTGKEIWQTDNKNEPVSANEDVKQNETWGFGMSDIAINNKKLINMSYSDLIKMFGNPKSVKSFLVPDPISGEDDGRCYNAASYDGVEFHFNTEKSSLGKINNEDTVFSFDITDSKVVLDCGLTVGMKKDEIIRKYGDRELLKLNKEDGEDRNPAEKILEDKPINYYNDYKDAMLIYCDTKKFEEAPLAMALVLLIKDNKVDKIVFGYPTAG